MIGNKKLLVAGFVCLFASLLVLGVAALRENFITPESLRKDTSSAFEAKEGPGTGSAYSMPSVGMRWWEEYGNVAVSRSSNVFATLISDNIYLQHAGHVEVEATLELATANDNNAEIRCYARKGTLYYYPRPYSTYWAGRGGSTAYQTRTFKWVFENMGSGSYTIYIAWRSMTNLKTVRCDERIMTTTWYMYP